MQSQNTTIKKKKSVVFEYFQANHHMQAQILILLRPLNRLMGLLKKNKILNKKIKCSEIVVNIAIQQKTEKKIE